MKSGLLIIFQLLFILLCCSCGDAEDKTAVIEVDKAPTTLSISDISSEIKEIPLAFSDSTQIGVITKVRFSDNYVFVQDQNNSRILKFDYNGNFKGQVGKKGEGPGEYKYLSSFTIDNTNKKVFISASGKILAYDFEGNFIKEKKGFNYVNAIEFVESELKVFNSKFGHESGDSLFNLEILIALDEELNQNDSTVIKEIPVKSISGTSFPKAKYFSGSEENYFFYIPVLISEEVIRDTLYRFNNNETSFFKKINFQPFQDPNSDNKAVNIKSIIKAGNYYMVEFLDQGEFTYLYNENDNKGFMIEGGLQASEYVLEEYIWLSPTLRKDKEAYFVGKPASEADATYEPNASVFLVTLN